MRLIFLPGLDGLGEMLGPVQEQLGFDSSTVLSYPTDQALGYDDLCLYVRERWPTEDFVLIVDSFSGPVAIKEIASGLKHCKALILVSSFARHPVPGLLLRLAYPLLPLILHVPPPQFALRALLLGWDAKATLGRRMQGAIAKVSSSVLAHRFRELAMVDVRDQVPAIKVPTLYLQGTRDHVVGRSAGLKLQALNPTIQITTLDAPHLILQAKPEDAGKVILDFLRDQSLCPEDKINHGDALK